MTRRARIGLYAAGGFLGLLIVLTIAGIMVARSDWLREKVRQGIISELETDTGGKVEIGALRFDWKTLTADVDKIVIHGTEPAGEPPLLRADRVQVELKITSLLNLTKGIDVASLGVQKPDAHLIVYPDGRTNVPTPKVAKKSDRSAVETVLDLKIGHFNLRNGTVEVKSPGKPPTVTAWDAKGENLRSLFTYESAGPRYRGDLNVTPLQLRWGVNGPVLVDVTLGLLLEKNRVQVTNAKLATKESQIDLTGALDNFASPQTTLNYNGKISVEELGKILALKSRQSGTVELSGTAHYADATNYTLTGKLHAGDIGYRDGDVRLDHVRADSNITADPRKVELTGMKIGVLGGEVVGKAELLNMERFQVEGNLEHFNIGQLMGLVSRERTPYDGAVSGPFRVGGELSRPMQTLQATARLNVLPVNGGLPLTGVIDAKYNAAKNTIDLTNSYVALPHTRVDLSGTVGNQLHVHLVSTNLDDLLPAIRASSPAAPAALPVKLQNGSAVFDGAITGAVAAPKIAGHIAVANAVYSGRKIDALSADIGLQKSGATIDNGLLTLGAARARIQGSVGMRNWKVEDNQPLTAGVSVQNADVAALLALAGQKDVPATGSLTTTAQVSGTVGNPHATADLNLVRGALYGEPFDRLTGKLDYLNGGTQTGNFQMNAGPSQVNLKATFEHAPTNFFAGKLNFQVSSNQLALGQFRTPRQYQSMISGNAQLNTTGAATLSRSKSGQTQFQISALNGNVDFTKGKIYDEPFDRLTVKLDSPNAGLQSAVAQLNAGAKQINLKANFEHAPTDFQNGKLAFEVSSNRLALAQLQTVQKYRPGVSGNVQLNASGSAVMSQSKTGAQFQLANLNADVNASTLNLDGNAVGDAHLTAKTQGTALAAHLESDIANSAIRGDGQWQLTGDYPGTAHVTFSKVDLAAVQALAAPPKSGSMSFGGTIEGKVDISGPATKPETWTAALEVPHLEIKPLPGAGMNAANLANLIIRNSGPLRVSMAKSVVQFENVHFVAQSTDVAITGAIDLKSQKNPLNMRVNGTVDLGLLHTLNRDVLSSGTVVADANVRGSFDQPLIGGRMELKKANLNMIDVPNGLTNANGLIVFDGTRATIQDLTAESGGGKIKAGGFVSYSGGSLAFRLNATANEVRLRYPEGVSTVADANLSFTGTTERSLLAGDVTILRTGFNPRTDLGSVISGSAAPLQTPTAKTGLLGGMQFNVQIATSPDISFQSAVAEGIQAEANLRLRGTASNPVLLGRINITQGDLTFFGNKYVINQGSISFYNPVKLEPILNVDLETRARGVDVTLTVSGTPAKLNVTYRSDPPLQFSDIVALLATGRAPADPSIAARQTGPPQTWQQMGASALVGQAIANPVAGRLQRFFGVSKLKIDPLVAGVSGRSQTRLTIEQQVTPDITFTYITDVTSSNPQIVRVEWAINRTWSAVAIRDETSSFGIDFLYKKQFK